MPFWHDLSALYVLDGAMAQTYPCRPMPDFRSLLFVPASRPARFPRALRAGADAVCIDLEDSVAPGEKDAARSAAAEYLSQRTSGGVALGVRLNGAKTAWWPADAAVVGPLADFVMIPKADSREQLIRVAAALPGAALWPLVETAQGLMHAWGIAAAPGVQGVLFGAFDYAADVGCAMEWDALLWARSALAAACARARVELLDAPSGDIGDADGLLAATRRAKALGFTGRACIHPDQVEGVNGVFTPSRREVDQARRILDAFETAAGGAAQLNGKLIELPVALAARRVLARAGD
jgi:citrate lyase beta subunit